MEIHAKETNKKEQKEATHESYHLERENPLKRCTKKRGLFPCL